MLMNQLRTNLRPIFKKTILATAFACVLSACGTLTGIPSHGGGKRFATEQRLVSASIRSALKDIDLSALTGKKVAIIFDLIHDEGGGSIDGGRLSLTGALSRGLLMSPMTTTASAFQVFNLIDSNSNYSNSNFAGSNTASSSLVTTGGATTTGQSNSAGTNASGTNTTSSSSGSSTNSGNNSGTNTSNTNTSNSGTNTGGYTTNTTGSNSGTNTVTGTTNNVDTTTGTWPGVTTSAGGNSQTSSGTGTNNSAGSGINNASSTNTAASNTAGGYSGTNASNSSNTNNGSGSSTSAGNNSSASNNQSNTTNNSSTASNQTSNTNNTTSQAGGGSNNRQVISSQPTSTSVQTSGYKTESGATLAYKGLGEYHNFNVPKSGASLLMGLTRTYLLLNGITPTTPTDPSADALLYVTVDIFGIIRQRTDYYIYNEESVLAETAIEMTAYDRKGKLIVNPVVANREARYKERYLLWAGPFNTDETLHQGKGLMVDFTDLPAKNAAKLNNTVKKDEPSKVNPNLNLKSNDKSSNNE